MPNIANLTLAQLRLATKAQIITAIANYLTNNFTKRQLIGFLIDAEVVSDPPVTTYRMDGQIESETDTDRDAETGALVASRQVRWFYYPTGEVDTITITQGATVRTIKHYLNRRQPTVTIQAAPKSAAPFGTSSPAAIAPGEELDWPGIVIAALVVLAFALLAFFERFPWLTH